MEDNKLEQLEQEQAVVQDTVQDTEQVEEVTEPTEPKEPTLQEKIEMIKAKIAHFENSIKLTNELIEKNEGDEFVARDTLFRVTKVTPSGEHMDIEMYKLEGTEDKPIAGEWIGKERVIKKKLTDSISNGNTAIRYFKKELERLKKELEKEIPIIEEGE